MRIWRVQAFFLGFLFVTCLCSCASVVNGTHQEIPIYSQPANASVTFNGEPKGVTPLILDIPRSKRGVGVIEISKPGYESQRFETRQRVSGAFWGNLGFLLVGGLPFMAIDGISGGWANIYPHRLTSVRLDPVASQDQLVQDHSSNQLPELATTPRR